MAWKPLSPDRRSQLVVCAALAHAGYLLACTGVAAPWVMTTFGLNAGGLATMFAWMSLSAIGAFAAGRLMDRVGRRRILIGCVALGSACAGVAAWSPDVVIFGAAGFAVNLLAGATVGGGVVMLSELAGRDDHARAQSWGAMSITIGSAGCVVLMPVLARTALSWRALFGVAAAGLFAVPFMRRYLAEGREWRDRRQDPLFSAARARDVFNAAHRRDTWPLLLGVLLSTMATSAVDPWRYFHTVRVVGLSPTLASATLLTAGGAALVGFRGGAWLADTVGRVPTVSAGAITMGLAIMFTFLGPPVAFPVAWLWMGVGFCAISAAGNVIAVGANCTVTELFPASLRGTILGWFALTGALGRVLAQTTVAWLAPRVGGPSTVVGLLGVLGILVGVLFAAAVRETRVHG